MREKGRVRGQKRRTKRSREKQEAKKPRAKRACIQNACVYRKKRSWRREVQRLERFGVGSCLWVSWDGGMVVKC